MYQEKEKKNESIQNIIYLLISNIVKFIFKSLCKFQYLQDLILNCSKQNITIPFTSQGGKFVKIKLLL